MPLVDTRQEIPCLAFPSPLSRRCYCVFAAARLAAQSPAAAPGGLLVSTAELAAGGEGPLARHPPRRRPRIGLRRRHTSPARAFSATATSPSTATRTSARSCRRLHEAKRVFEAVGVSNNSRVVVYATSPGHRRARVLHARRDGPQRRGAPRRRPPRLARREAADRDGRREAGDARAVHADLERRARRDRAADPAADADRRHRAG